MDAHLYLAFFAAAVLISLSPGAGALNTMSNGARHGVRHSVPAILGLQLGYGAQILLVGIGLGALVASSSLTFTLVKWVGVAYLAWLGIQKWREGHQMIASDSGEDVSTRKRFWQAAFVNLTNPKATVFLIALFPQFLDASAPQGPQLAVMGSTLLMVDTVVMLGYALLASQLLRWMRSPRQQAVLNRVFGSIFIVAAGFLARFRVSQ
ncbi:homoserine/homoserine lactone efflux protein [Marinobacteraceae bacterium S3BR75-40.1]